MIDIARLLRATGRFLFALAVYMLVPLLYGLFAGEDNNPFYLSIAFTCLSGGSLVLIFRRKKSNDLPQREGILLVSAVWVSVTFFGCLPFYFSGHYAGFTDAFFEAASGFTTTGATVVGDVEALPGNLLLWRCLSSWIGGMGAILLGVAVLPLVGIGGMPLYRADFPGARSEKLAQRVSEAARSIWKIYVALTLAIFLALRLAGMNLFDALCYSFSAVSTGGFSTRNAGIAAFNNPVIEGILIVGMLAAGINFTLHYRLWIMRRVRRFFADTELRFYLMVAATATVIVFLSLIIRDRYTSLEAMRHSLFQVCSLMTGTGLSTDNYGNWDSFSQLTLLALMFFGGCTGSTSGGLKSSRILMLMKVVGREFQRMVERRGVFTVRIGSTAVPERTVQSLLNLLYLAFIANLLYCLLLSLSGIGVFTSISAVAACTFNVGPGFDLVGPQGHYGDLPFFAKWILSICMVAGRLEFYTLLVLCTRAFWRR